MDDSLNAKALYLMPDMNMQAGEVMIAVLRDGIDDPNGDLEQTDFLWIKSRPVSHLFLSPIGIDTDFDRD